MIYADKNNNNNRYDLHIHTNFSDGEYSPNEIIEMALNEDLKGISITDHDNIDGYIKIRDTKSINIIAGIEFSCLYLGETVHLLGYCFDTNNKHLLQTIEKYKKNKLLKIKEYIKKTKSILKQSKKQQNLQISFKEYDDYCKINNLSILYRLNLVKYLTSRKMCSGDKEKVKKIVKRLDSENTYYDIAKIIDIIKNASGIAVLAHPLKYNSKINYNYLKQKGLDGIEVYHYSSKEDYKQKQLLSIAKKYNLLITGGSDFHNKISSKGLGSYSMNESEYIKLINNDV